MNCEKEETVAKDQILTNLCRWNSKYYSIIVLWRASSSTKLRFAWYIQKQTPTEENRVWHTTSGHAPHRHNACLHLPATLPTTTTQQPPPTAWSINLFKLKAEQKQRKGSHCFLSVWIPHLVMRLAQDDIELEMKWENLYLLPGSHPLLQVAWLNQFEQTISTSLPLIPSEFQIY